MADNELEFVDEEDTALATEDTAAFSEAVLYSSDWTVETVISQMTNSNIEMNPRFQRRDAWSPGGKSRFIESIILGFPIPQIVLAEKKGKKGQFIVLDGKQRLLSLLQFTGRAEGARNGFRLSGLEVRADLNRKSYTAIKDDPNRRDDINAFLNNTIRTVVIRNWPSTNFLHIVFLRLNTGSVKLSPQELRQAMVPGPFSEFIDDTALASAHTQRLLGRTSPDPRMRDVELLVRFLGFRNFLPTYGGRMKEFLDGVCQELTDTWANSQPRVQGDLNEFNSAVDALIEIFGADEIARKPGSKSFNRAIFDALAFYAADHEIRNSMTAHSGPIKDLYAELMRDDRFSKAIESDTAGIPHTFDRLSLWGLGLRRVLGIGFNVPMLIEREDGSAGIGFDGFR
ncbi:DUF262 domain-containing protein [Methylorubrum extorquens]|uniref:DUF262 domain-containing protein n=1 Tax=Methylorubrum extorquens TaxID=408 RepID=UPI001EE60521|nr:DUF262 domain-containing protein [Methylorubrum extorquens]MCG5247917.1 DUF262 domain-containing protein [Methylorubrum extorquens]